MKPVAEAAIQELENLAGAIDAAFTDDRPMMQIWGWNMPTLTRSELANIPRDLAKRLAALPESAIVPELELRLSNLPARIEFLRAQSIPNLAGGNAFYVVDQVSQLVQWVEALLPAPPPAKLSVDWQEVSSKNLLPSALLRKLRGLEASLRAIEPRATRVAEQMAAIEAAHAAAESLPTDLATLEEARSAVESAKVEVEKAVNRALQNADTTDGLVLIMKDSSAEAGQLVKNCEEAYRITTTKGLAGAFDQRAKALSQTVVAWVAGLLLALGGGAYIGAQRLQLLQEMMKAKAPAETLWLHVVLAIFSVAAPVWFAWLSTKQIGQRFRLAEDYGFKASVAKAYEGYRREAARIDPAFEARLFGSALTRLEEAPLRLVEHENYGSPWHELTSSTGFEKALQLIPDLKTKYLQILSSAKPADASTAASEGG